MVSNSENQTAATDMYQLDPFGILKRKFWTILFFVVCCVALALLYYFKAPKTFQSEAKVYIADRRAATMSVDGSDVERSPIEKYLEIINSRAVLDDAIEESGIDNLQSLSNADDPLYYVRENLIATSADTKSASEVMKLRFQTEVEEDAQVILTNILASFDSFIKRGSEDTGVDMLSTMSKLEQERTTRFSKLMKEIDGLMQKPFIQVVEGKVYNQYEGQASKLQTEMDENASERLRYVALRDNLIKVRDAGGNIEDLVIDTMQDMNEGQLGGYTTTHQKYLELRVLEKEMMGEFGSDHPQLQNLRQQIIMVDNMRKEQLLSAIRTSSDVTTGGDFFTVVLDHIDNKLRFFKSHEVQLTDAIRDSKLKSLEISSDCERLSMLLAERELMTATNFQMQDKVQEYGVLQGFDWQDVRVLDPASKAEQVAPSLPISLAAGLLLGALFGFIFAALKEMAEKTFRSTDDVSRQLGVSVVAQIEKFSPKKPRNSEYKKVSGDLIALHQPQSQAAESFKALRTSIFFRAKQDSDLKLIQITSPSAGDGKSVVSSNLAVVMAQSGRRVLLIDCDLRRQTQHTRFGIGNQVGVTSIVSGETSLVEAVQETGILNLSLLSSGPPCGNPAEILTTDDFAKMLNDTRDMYDFVIVDTPPILPVTDPVIISNFVDAIYMPMRIRKGVQVKSQRAIEALALIGQHVDGIVINGLSRKEAGSYSYGGYGRGGYAKYGAYKSAQPLQTGSTESFKNGHSSSTEQIGSVESRS